MIKRLLAHLLVFLIIITTVLFPYADVSAASLKFGMEGEEIATLQQDLKKLGYFTFDKITGYFGEITEQAVMAFQKKNGLVVDGIAGKNTLSMLQSLKTTTRLLKFGLRGEDVRALQEDLIALGYLNCEATGYYGELTTEAVKALQKKYGLSVDGIAGSKTLALTAGLLSGTQIIAEASRSTDSRSSGYMMNWFDGVENIFKRGTTATVYDIETGLSFMVKRNYGTNHADCETLTQDDTDTMLLAYGGEWSWNRRAIVVSVGGYIFAASMAGMPHAGLESEPAGKYVSNRTGDFGYGYNYDSIKGNGMSGHFCIHFKGSMLHEKAQTEARHQEKVKEANEWLERNGGKF